MVARRGGPATWKVAALPSDADADQGGALGLPYA